MANAAYIETVDDICTADFGDMWTNLQDIYVEYVAQTFLDMAKDAATREYFHIYM